MIDGDCVAREITVYVFPKFIIVLLSLSLLAVDKDMCPFLISPPSIGEITG